VPLPPLVPPPPLPDDDCCPANQLKKVAAGVFCTGHGQPAGGTMGEPPSGLSDTTLTWVHTVFTAWQTPATLVVQDELYLKFSRSSQVTF